MPAGCADEAWMVGWCAPAGVCVCVWLSIRRERSYRVQLHCGYYCCEVMCYK